MQFGRKLLRGDAAPLSDFWLLTILTVATEVDAAAVELIAEDRLSKIDVNATWVHSHSRLSRQRC